MRQSIAIETKVTNERTNGGRNEHVTKCVGANLGGGKKDVDDYGVSDSCIG